MYHITSFVWQVYRFAFIVAFFREYYLIVSIYFIVYHCKSLARRINARIETPHCCLRLPNIGRVIRFKDDFISASGIRNSEANSLASSSTLSGCFGTKLRCIIKCPSSCASEKRILSFGILVLRKMTLRPRSVIEVSPSIFSVPKSIFV